MFCIIYTDLNLRSRAREIMASPGTHASGAHFPYTFEIFGSASHGVEFFGIFDFHGSDSTSHGPSLGRHFASHSTFRFKSNIS